ncbi:hypothetical protein H6F95_05475, partial [Cyanobacteria bacterium FACHB-471]|nr:hypothetical protein [Cyanobacteria bacterium FACHB-471]
MKSLPKPLRVALLLIPLLVVVGFLGYRVEIALPTAPPKLSSTFTLVTQVSSQEIGSYDLLGYTISKAEADRLSLTEEGKLNRYLSSEKLTPRLLWEQVKPLIVPDAAGYLIFDDTVL